MQNESKKDNALTVSQLTELIKTMLESSFQNIILKGEISNYKPSSSGHLYFSLKDSDSQISAVMFRGAASALNFIPKEPNHMNSKQLAEYIGLNSRDVRLIIQKLRDDGYPICATPAQGYWMARTSCDMNDTMIKLKSHIENSIDTYNSLVKSQNELKRKEGNNEYTELLV